MTLPLVSAITACYRGERYLKTFLEWLPRQTLFDRLEVVLDHNEPTREELECVRSFQNRYPGRLKHMIIDKVDPMGVSWNRCIREAQADLLAVWNVDDLRTDDSIERQATTLLDHTDAAIACGGFITVSQMGRTEGPYTNYEGVPEEEFTRRSIGGPFFMFRKSFCDRAGLFDEQLTTGLDFDFQVRLAIHGRARITKGNLGYYLNEGRGSSTRPDTLQPIERTVIDLRYGIYDKVNYRHVARAARYNIPFILNQGRWLPVDHFVPDYESFLRGRMQQWHNRGLLRFIPRYLIESSPLWKGARGIKRAVRRALSAP
jgi:hypothetical protein